MKNYNHKLIVDEYLRMKMRNPELDDRDLLDIIFSKIKTDYKNTKKEIMILKEQGASRKDVNDSKENWYLDFMINHYDLDNIEHDHKFIEPYHEEINDFIEELYGGGE